MYVYRYVYMYVGMLVGRYVSRLSQLMLIACILNRSFQMESIIFLREV